MFSVVDFLPAVASRVRNHVYLVTDRWDDWGKYRTMFSVYIVDADGSTLEPGSLKIGEVGLQPRSAQVALEQGFRAPALHREFDNLEAVHFSLGQTENYYETLNLLEPAFKNAVLVGLRDCAFDLELFNLRESEYVMSESLLRSVSAQSVRYRFNRLAHGNALLTRFEFEYELPSSGFNTGPPPVLTFQVIPYSEPPTNVHVLIGRNGVGKTRCIQSLCRTVLGGVEGAREHGELRLLGGNADEWTFSRLVSVSFSVFDDFDLPLAPSSEITATQVGLRYKVATESGEVASVKTPDMLAQDFILGLGCCRTGPRATRWLAALETLEADPLFEEADAGQLISLPDDQWEVVARHLFRRLSSGHAIVLLTMTRLVELVDERTLVILDEPEGHLHPPLLAAFVRGVSDLLIKRNGVALIATHSPVVLQEVPRSCVWKIRRTGAISNVERPTVETFGENVGVLTREVFGLEVTNSGFHHLLRKTLAVYGSYDEALAHFNDQLGAEARAILMGLAARRNDSGRSDDEIFT